MNITPPPSDAVSLETKHFHMLREAAESRENNRRLRERHAEHEREMRAADSRRRVAEKNGVDAARASA